MDEEREEGPRVIVKQDLLQMRTRALRLNLWFRVLSKIERSIVDLTLKCVERIRSSVLEATITNILDKIVQALACRFITKADDTGRKVAEKLCETAKKWGNKNASTWKNDTVFIRFLGISALNN